MRRVREDLAEVTPVALVRHPRMKEGIVDSVRGAILEGKLAPGTVLRQEHLARQLHVSRTPLREALIALEREGFVTIAPSAAASVVSLDVRDALEIMDLREMVDGLAARLLAQRGIGAELDRDLTALAKTLRTNADFHVEIVEATGHTRLRQFIPLVRMSAQVVSIRLQNQGRRLTHSADEHTRVLDAIRCGDADSAERFAREHVRNAAAHWLDR